MAQQSARQLIALDLFPEAGEGFDVLDNPLLQGSETSKLCSVCGNTVVGVVMQCVKKNLAVHPKCATFKKVMRVGDLVFDTVQGELKSSCDLCGRMDQQGFHCKSRCEKSTFHVHCMISRPPPPQQQRNRTGNQMYHEIESFATSMLSFIASGGLPGLP